MSARNVNYILVPDLFVDGDILAQPGKWTIKLAPVNIGPTGRLRGPRQAKVTPMPVQWMQDYCPAPFPD